MNCLKILNTKKALSKLVPIATFTYVLLITCLISNTPVVKAAKLSDGTWVQGGAPGTTTVTFTNGATELDSSSDIVLTFPSTASVDQDGTTVTVTGQGTVVRTNNTLDNTITLTIDGTIATSLAVTITLADGLTSYTTTTYAQESVAINTQDSTDTPVDFGVALITNDNTTDITAQVPLFVNFAIDTTTINLGTLSTASVNEADQTYTVNSNNTSGVTLQITRDAAFNDGSGNDINDVADGTVTASSEEYGITFDGTGGGIALQAPFDSGDDAVPAVATTFANTSSTVSNGTFDINYRASISGSTVAGSYDQVVTVTISTNA